MKQERLIWVLIVALALVGAALLYVLTRDDGPNVDAAPATTARAQPTAPVARFTRAAATADPNGFANVRSGPSVEHPVVGRVEHAENFTTYPQNGDWWEVRTADGTTGYMAYEWIRMIGDGAPIRQAAAPAQPIAAAAVPAASARPRNMIFPDSDRRLLNSNDISGMSVNELRVARNEIYARRGRAFSDPSLRRYFAQFGWYRPVAAEVALNRVETVNVAFLQAAESGK